MAVRAGGLSVKNLAYTSSIADEVIHRLKEDYATH
jgi:hypothetical protein